MAKDKYASNQQIDPSFFDRPKPPPFKCTRFIYNSKEGTICGRTIESWGKQNKESRTIFL